MATPSLPGSGCFTRNHVPDNIMIVNTLISSQLSSWNGDAILDIKHNDITDAIPCAKILVLDKISLPNIVAINLVHTNIFQNLD